MSHEQFNASDRLLKYEDKSDLEGSESQYSADLLVPVYQKSAKPRRSYFIHLVHIIPWFLLIILGAWDLIRYQKTKPCYPNSQIIYSPAQHLIEYEPRVFTSALHGDMSPFSEEPSPEVDDAWHSLYPSLVQLIPKEQASKLLMPTAVYPHNADRKYMIELDVFHQLHCLNMIRKALRPDYYVPEIDENGEIKLVGHTHITHCVETIRQSLMCAGDITTYTWQWDQELQTLRNHVSTPHSCRNFDKLRGWAVEHNGAVPFDNFRELNDSLDPTTWVDGYSGE